MAATVGVAWLGPTILAQYVGFSFDGTPSN
jgi:hypothetical protein